MLCTIAGRCGSLAGWLAMEVPLDNPANMMPRESLKENKRTTGLRNVICQATQLLHNQWFAASPPLHFQFIAIE
jgi:hypothetical protein